MNPWAGWLLTFYPQLFTELAAGVYSGTWHIVLAIAGLALTSVFWVLVWLWLKAIDEAAGQKQVTE